MDAYFAPIDVKRVPLFDQEVLGRDRLEILADRLYPNGEDPASVTHLERPYTFRKKDSHYEVHISVPFTTKGEVGLFKKDDELVVEVGTLRRHIGLPISMAALSPTRARLENKILIVEMKEVAG
jgi:arsenite-transporting ATPase